MPLANQPLSAAEFLALYCFIYGLETQGGTANLADAIDYENCPYSESPENLDLLGSSGGISWRGRIQRILEFNCGGCHAGNQAQAGLDLKDGDVYARLMQPSGQQPELKLIEAGVPAESYLWLKLTGDPSIDGFAMPFNPLTGAGRLRDDELSDIRAWIQAGAPMDDASADAPTQNSPASSTSSSPDAGPPLGDGGP